MKLALMRYTPAHMLIGYGIIAEAILKAKDGTLLMDMQMMIAEDLPYGWLVRPQILNPIRTDELEGYVKAMGGISSWINPWTYFKVHRK